VVYIYKFKTIDNKNSVQKFRENVGVGLKNSSTYTAQVTQVPKSPSAQVPKSPKIAQKVFYI
jgi:hypothetical protein